jgi:hypothetical protein
MFPGFRPVVVTPLTCKMHRKDSNVRTMSHRRSLLTPVGRAPALVLAGRRRSVAQCTGLLESG